MSRQSTRSITPPFVNISPSYSAFSARLSAVKNKAPNGATIATKHVIMKR